jgi:hypothetical protein
MVGHEKRRHTDFSTQKPEGGTAEIKDVGKLLGRGTPKGLMEQDIYHPEGSRIGRVVSDYFDPNTGQNFLRTTELGSELQENDKGTVSVKNKADTYRQIDVLGQNGKSETRYVFDQKNGPRMESLDSKGKVTGVTQMSKDTNYKNLVKSLSQSESAAGKAQQAQTAPKKNQGRSGRLAFTPDKVIRLGQILLTW